MFFGTHLMLMFVGGLFAGSALSGHDGLLGLASVAAFGAAGALAHLNSNKAEKARQNAVLPVDGEEKQSV